MSTDIEQNALATDILGAARHAGVSADIIRREIHAGNLRAKRVGKKYSISFKALADWHDQLPDA